MKHVYDYGNSYGDEENTINDECFVEEQLVDLRNMLPDGDVSLYFEPNEGYYVSYRTEGEEEERRVSPYLHIDHLIHWVAVTTDHLVHFDDEDERCLYFEMLALVA